MKRIGLRVVLCSVIPIVITACSTTVRTANPDLPYVLPPEPVADYASRIPQSLSTGEKTILIDPNVHTWGAYNASGELVKAGVASAGANWCSDLGRPCHTKAGSFRVYSLGAPTCKSHIFPIPRGGAPMPYCMFFHGGQALHGVPPNEVGEGNYSHGCVRLQVSDAEWLRYNFAEVGTKVIVRSY